MNIRVARIFNTYGPRMGPNDGRVVSNFITQALRNEPITIYGDGSQARSFFYCDDLIDGFVRLMGASDEVTGPINLGNPVEFTIRQLAKKIIKLSGTKSEVIYQGLSVDGPLQRRPIIEKAKNEIDWQPFIRLEEELIKTIECFSGLD